MKSREEGRGWKGEKDRGAEERGQGEKGAMTAGALSGLFDHHMGAGTPSLALWPLLERRSIMLTYTPYQRHL